jgi:predicted RNase H-like HicB family nuclease
MKTYLVIVEKTETGYSAYSPDLPGCGSTGKTKEEVEHNIKRQSNFILKVCGKKGTKSANLPPTPHILMSLHE